jgi:RNA polymerase sigma-70 factor (ECF subfamily)
MMGPQVPKEIIEAARSGGPADVERLLEAVWVDAYRLAVAILPHRQSAEDVAQEACVIMFRSIASLRNPEAFRTWFYRIVVREALKQKKLEAASMTLSTDVGYCDDRSDLIDLWRTLGTLSDKLRTVIVLHYFEALTSREIGRILGIPEATVRFRLLTARRKLRPLLKEHASSTHSKGEEVYAL